MSPKERKRKRRLKAPLQHAKHYQHCSKFRVHGAAVVQLKLLPCKCRVDFMFPLRSQSACTCIKLESSHRTLCTRCTLINTSGAVCARCISRRRRLDECGVNPCAARTSKSWKDRAFNRWQLISQLVTRRCAEINFISANA